MTTSLHLGIDVGTTAVKAAVFRSSGEIVAYESRNCETIVEKPGWSAQSMKSTWDHVSAAVHAMSNSTDLSKISSVGVCGQGDGLWMLNDNYEPVQDAILWNDQRSSSYIEQWAANGTSEHIANRCKTNIWSGTSGAIYRWLLDNEPETAKRSRYSVNCKDWINFKFTGELSTDYSDASIPFLDLANGNYDKETFDLMRVGDLASKMIDPVASTSLNGHVSEKTAGETGLLPDTPVASGCLDVAAMMCGMNLNEKGDICLILGTTAVLAAVVEPDTALKVTSGATVMHPYQDRWIRALAPLSGTSALDWFNRSVIGHAYGNASSRIPEELIAEASSVPPGSNGVIFLPFLNGERAPFVAPNAKASFLGMTSSTTSAELVRAVMEGTAMSLRHCLETIDDCEPDKLLMSGGGARNKLWCDILASVLNVSVRATQNSDYGLWGAAAIGTMAAGSLDVDGIPQRSESTNRHDPDPRSVSKYDELFQRYLETVRVSQAFWQ